MLNLQIEPLEVRIAPATVLTSAVFTSENTVLVGTYDGGTNADIEFFAKPIGGAPFSLGAIAYSAAAGPTFSANAPVLEPGHSITAIVTPTGGIADAESTPIGATRGLWVERLLVNEGSGTNVAYFSVRMSLPSAKPVTVQYATVAETASAGTDFTAATGMLTFLPGETTKTVPVAITGDSVSEGVETFSLAIGSANGATIAVESAQGIVLDDDASSPANIGVYLVPTAVLEGGVLTVEARLTRAAGIPVVVEYGTQNGNSSPAIAGSDYSATTGTLNFGAGEIVKTISIPLLDDSAFEGREYLFLQITAATQGLEFISPIVELAISDNDAPAGPTISIADTSITEGTSTTANSAITFTVTLSSPALEQVVVRLSAGEDTAIASDFQVGDGTLTIEIGESGGTIDIPVRADNFAEPNERLFVALDSIRGAVAGDTFAIGTINNDDAGLPILEILDTTVSETNTSGAAATFSVRLSLPSSTNVTVAYNTGLGTALGGFDYIPASGTLTFLPGETAKTITVPIIGDTSYESTEVFGVTLSSATGATIARSIGAATIFDNDAVNTSTPQVRVLDQQFSEGTGGESTGSVTVKLDHAAPSAVTVRLKYRNGTAVIGTDVEPGALTITIPAGSDFGVANFAIAPDFALEANEYFHIDVASATGASIADSSARLTLINDDAGPVISEDQKTARWRDIDGDLVTLNASKGILTTENFAMVPANAGLILGALFLTDPSASGISISISAKGPGNSISMGAIIATGNNLGTVKVQGDISRIIAGDSPQGLAVATLDLISIGANGGAFDLENTTLSKLAGSVRTFVVRKNFESSAFSVDSSTGQSIGSLKIAGQLKGGSASGAGYIFASGDIGKIEIRGGIAGGAGLYSGAIETIGNIGSISITGGIQGAGGERSGSIFAHGFHPTSAAGIGTFKLTGSLKKGAGAVSGVLYSFGAISSATISGDITGGAIFAGGVAKLAVTGSVTNAEIVSGFTIHDSGLANPTSSPAPTARATAGFGKVTVGGNWIASSISADVSPGTDGLFGTQDDSLFFSNTTASIQSILIKGTATGTTTTGDAFGFVARTIGKFRSANSDPILDPAVLEVVPIGGGGDIALREIGH